MNDIASPTAKVLASSPVRLDSIELRIVRLPLAEPFETSLWRVDSRLIPLVCMEADGVKGWGEIVAMESPVYSYETVKTCQHVIRDCFAPLLLAKPLAGLDDLAARLAHFRGHPMARAGLELAFTDLVAKLRKESLSKVLGGTRTQIPVGVSLGIEKTPAALFAKVERNLAEGYRRIKLKIRHGWDLEVVSEVRRRHPDILLSVDANAAYTLADRAHLRKLDQYKLLMMEQPLPFDDLLDHAELQKEIKTDVCLDESITGLRAAQAALTLKSCRIINMKIGRVGGYSQGLPIHDLCVQTKTNLWCGGMLESGVGRAHNVALASLPGFTLPGDISASRRYFVRDVIVPEVKVNSDGMVEVPTGPGLGYEVDTDYLKTCTESVERFAVGAK